MGAQGSGTDIRIERWPNGAVKAREPFVNGVREGLATYTHDNGVLYGIIPWKNGQKEGSFRLFRQDGTLEQELSYHQGKPHGMCRWYNPDGSLYASAEYLEGRVVSTTSSSLPTSVLAPAILPVARASMPSRDPEPRPFLSLFLALAAFAALILSRKLTRRHGID